MALLEEHYLTLQHWNRKISLTAIRDPKDIAERHFGESLFLARELGESPQTLMDVGSGAGFPGVPVAVCHSLCQTTLLEPVGKKFAFLKEISRSLPNVSVVQGRLEKVEGVYDWVSVRGVSVVPVLRDLAGKACRLAILTTRQAAAEMGSFEPVEWDRELAIPWGKQRILLLGHYSPRSPRST